MNIEINEDDFVRYLDSDESMRLIKKIDDKRGCCDFSCRVIKMLLESLSQDMTKEEMEEEFGFKFND
jgi:hypothetical protein